MQQECPKRNSSWIRLLCKAINMAPGVDMPKMYPRVLAFAVHRVHFGTAVNEHLTCAQLHEHCKRSKNRSVGYLEDHAGHHCPYTMSLPYPFKTVVQMSCRSKKEPRNDSSLRQA